MWLSTEACSPILRLTLDSWHRNESKSGLRSWFWVPVGPACETRQTLTDIFHSLSRKMWLFANDTKHRKIIYKIKAREETSWYIPVLSLNDDHRRMNDRLKPLFHKLPLLRPSLAIQRRQEGGIKFPRPWEAWLESLGIERWPAGSWPRGGSHGNPRLTHLLLARCRIGSHGFESL